MKQSIIKRIKNCRVLRGIQLFSWIIGFLGIFYAVLSLLSIVKKWVLIKFFMINEAQAFFLKAAIPAVMFAIVTTWFFREEIQKYNQQIQNSVPVVIKQKSVDEWISSFEETIKLKKLENGVLFGHFKAHMLHDIYIVALDDVIINQVFLENCVLIAKKRFHIRFRGTYSELTQKAIIFLLFQDIQEGQENLPGINFDCYPEGGFQSVFVVDFKQKRLQLPQLDGKYGTFLPNFLACVDWVFQMFPEKMTRE